MTLYQCKSTWYWPVYYALVRGIAYLRHLNYKVLNMFMILECLGVSFESEILLLFNKELLPYVVTYQNIIARHKDNFS